MTTRPRNDNSRRQDREAQRRYYEKNREKVYARNKAQLQRVVDYVHAAKAGPCLDCGVEYPPYVMDFDHVRGVKMAAIGDLVRRGFGIKTIADEIVKCELVCANCHRERTYGPSATSQTVKAPL